MKENLLKFIQGLEPDKKTKPFLHTLYDGFFTFAFAFRAIERFLFWASSLDAAYNGVYFFVSSEFSVEIAFPKASLRAEVVYEGAG